MLLSSTNNNNNNNATMADVAAATAVTVAAATGIFWWSKRPSRSRQKQQPPGRPPRIRRNLSFTSAYLAMGTYPPKAKFAEPIINCAMYFDGGELPSDEDIVEHAIKPILVYDRLSMIPIQDHAGNLRLPSPPLDPHKLVRRFQVNNQQELYQKIQNDIFPHLLTGNNPNREDLPWWEFVVLENITPNEPSMIIWRIHHALGDGISLATLAIRHVLRSAKDGSRLSFTSAFLPPSLMRRKSSLLEERPMKFNWFQRLYQILDAVATVFLLPTTKFDHPTIFSKASCKNDLVHNGIREIVVFPTIPLSLIQAIKNAANVTVNDILFCILSQAIHDYLLEEKCPVLHEVGIQLQCRALLAAALPRQEIMKETATTDDLLQNQFFLLSAEIYVGCNDILQRLQCIHNNFQRLKQSPLAYVGIRIQNRILKYFPLGMNRMGVYESTIRHSMTVSNVPGPRQPVLFCGRRIRGVHMFFSNLCPQFNIVTYAGRVYANLTVDSTSVPNCQSLSKFYHQAIIKLAQRLQVPVPTDVLSPLKEDEMRRRNE